MQLSDSFTFLRCSRPFTYYSHPYSSHNVRSDVSVSSSSSQLFPFQFQFQASSSSNDNDSDRDKNKIELAWCNEIECMSSKREQVRGLDNAITFTSPATGQVMYSWLDFYEKQEVKKRNLRTVLFLVKRDDDELMVDASRAVKQLTEELGIQVLLQPEYAAKLKHYYGVDNSLIHLFEVRARKVYSFFYAHI